MTPEPTTATVGIALRDSLQVATLPDGSGWRTPEVYVDAWKLQKTAADYSDELERLLVPEMARRCGVPESCVRFCTSRSAIFGHRRLIFWLSATRPRVKAVGALDGPSGPSEILELL